MKDLEMSENYYKAAVMQTNGEFTKPEYVPKKILIPRTVRSDSPFCRIVATPGEYDAEVNQFGAVSVDIDGEKLGIKPCEFEVIEWQPNPKL